MAHFGWSFTRVYASIKFLWSVLCFFVQCWMNILYFHCKDTASLTHIGLNISFSFGCTGTQSHKLSDLPQPCDDILSESYCLTPQEQTAGIVTDFVESLCHQSSKPTTARQANIRCRDQSGLYLRIMDEPLRSRVLGDHRPLKPIAYKFNFRNHSCWGCCSLVLVSYFAEQLAPGLHCPAVVERLLKAAQSTFAHGQRQMAERGHVGERGSRSYGGEWAITVV